MASSSEISVAGTPTLRNSTKRIGRPAALGHAGGGDVGGGGDEREVAAEAGAERERPPVGVVHRLALELLDDGDHRRGEGDVVHDPRGDRRRST